MGYLRTALLRLIAFLAEADGKELCMKVCVHLE